MMCNNIDAVVPKAGKPLNVLKQTVEKKMLDHEDTQPFQKHVIDKVGLQLSSHLCTHLNMFSFYIIRR